MKLAAKLAARLPLSALICAIAQGACVDPGPSAAPAPHGGQAAPGPENEAPPEPAPVMPSLSTEVATRYLAFLAPRFAQRPLDPEELSDLQARQQDAILPILSAWARAPALEEVARLWISTKLYTSGSRDGIDFNLPGNLAAHLVRQKLPLTRLLTADECIDAAGASTACDTGAWYRAGVLTTRAFMASRAGRFNLTRSSMLMKAFACRSYPQEDTLQPQVDRTALIPMFQARTAEEQTDARATNGFGNGSGCYSCHGQFAAHAQLFVKFDESGRYQVDAPGAQDPSGELGKALAGLYASHFTEPARAASEASQFLGREVTNLAGAAKVLAEHPVFLACQARNLLEFGVALDATAAVDATLFERIVEDARRANPEPTFGDLFVATYAYPRVVEAIVQALEGGP